ncbi:hypothetical protein NXW84_05175 [Bacteroides fragilis]|nr:hypothetical protein NXW84_05175 [Bacteroides fragilis]
MSEEVIPRLCAKFRTDAIVHRTFTVQNYPESVLAEKLESWEMALPACLKLAYLPKPGLIRLRLTGRGQNRSEVEACVNTESAKLEAILGEDILDEEDTPIEILIGELFKEEEFDSFYRRKLYRWKHCSPYNFGCRQFGIF